jgi:hypothetical protein
MNHYDEANGLIFRHKSNQTKMHVGVVVVVGVKLVLAQIKSNQNMHVV